jgi:hypothetical protein
MPTDPQLDAPAASPSHATGPVTAEGKARSAMNATRHGICAARPAFPEADPGELDGLRAALVARYRPQDAAEAHWVEELVFTAWRQQRLRALEVAVLERAMATETGAEAPALPSLVTVIRYRARLDRDWRRAGEALHELRRARERLLPRARTHTAADMLAQAPRTNEPTPPIAMPHRVDGPRHPVPDLDDFGMNEPPLNRHERRRLAALARAAGRHAA